MWHAYAVVCDNNHSLAAAAAGALLPLQFPLQQLHVALSCVWLRVGMGTPTALRWRVAAWALSRAARCSTLTQGLVCRWKGMPRVPGVGCLRTCGCLLVVRVRPLCVCRVCVGGCVCDGWLPHGVRVSGAGVVCGVSCVGWC